MPDTELDKDWKAHRSKILGQSTAAKEAGANVVWVAERNACPSCLAYQGHVVAPGQAFPTGLTYGDAPIAPYGKLVGPPLHPHCRCELEETDLEPGTVDLNLAREAARSVARGLTDHASSAAKIRATRRLLARADRSGLLPKSVRERAARNVADAEFKDRPGSPGARREIAKRRAGAARRKASAPPKAPEAPVSGQSAAESLTGPALPGGKPRTALHRYTGMEYSSLNRALRAKQELDAEQEEIVRLVSSLARPAPVALTMHRGITGDGSWLPKPGGTLADPALISGTLSDKVARNFGRIRMEIEVPKGSLIIPVDQLQKGKAYQWEAPGQEEEIILPRGTKLIIVSDETINGVRVVKVRIVKQ